MSDIDPSIFMDSNEETNGSGTGSFNASLSEDAEEFSSSSLKDNYSLPNHDSLPVDFNERMKFEVDETDEKERRKMKEEFAKFGESIAVQLAKISDSYSRSVAKLRISQILFEAEIGVYAQMHR